MTEPTEKEYCFTYHFRGKEYGGTVFATNHGEAALKLSAMGKGKIDGLLIARIKVPSMFERILNWLHKRHDRT